MGNHTDSFGGSGRYLMGLAETEGMIEPDKGKQLGPSRFAHAIIWPLEASIRLFYREHRSIKWIDLRYGTGISHGNGIARS